MADKIFGQGLDPETLLYVAKAPALPNGTSPRPVHIKGLPAGGGATNDAIMAGVAADPASAFSAQLTDTIIGVGSGRFAPLTTDVHLDIWDGFNVNGVGENSWDSTTYEGFIAGIDAKLAGSGAVKVTLGTVTGGRSVFMYTIGPATAPHVLLNCGMHGGEANAHWSGMRFFTELATSDEPLMAALRGKARISYIPFLNPGNYLVGGRFNPNGVDINRNFPWNWNVNLIPEKGAAPLDQPETQIVKSVLDDYPIGLLIDCHVAGNQSPEMAYSTTSSSVHAHREIFAKAAAEWGATNTDAPTMQSFAGANDSNATLRNWGGKYLRWDKMRVNAASVLVECKSGVAGSVGDNLTRTGARWYASFIYRVILTWLEDGQSDPPLMAYQWWAFNDNFDATTRTTSITTFGGRLVDTTTYTPVKFSSSASGANTNYLGFPVRHPGRYLIEWTANVELEAASGPARIDGRAGISTMPNDGSNVTAPHTSSSGYCELQKAGDFGSLGGRFLATFATVPDEALQMVQLFFRVSTAGEKVILRDGSSVNLTVTPLPNFDPSKMPVVTRPV